MAAKKDLELMIDNRYFCKFAGNKLLPIINDEFLTDDYIHSPPAAQFSSYMHTEFHICFYDRDGEIATPTGGMIYPEVSDFDGVWHGLQTNGTIMATDVKPTGDYVIPCYAGFVRQAKVVFSGVNGGNVASAICYVVRN